MRPLDRTRYLVTDQKAGGGLGQWLLGFDFVFQRDIGNLGRGTLSKRRRHISRATLTKRAAPNLRGARRRFRWRIRRGRGRASFAFYGDLLERFFHLPFLQVIHRLKVWVQHSFTKDLHKQGKSFLCSISDRFLTVPE